MQPTQPVNVPTLVFGLATILLGLTVWTMVPGRRHLRAVRLWTSGSVILGAGSVLTACWGFGLPTALWLSLAGGLDPLSFALRTQALRLHMDMPLHWPRVATLLALQALVCALVAHDGAMVRYLVYTQAVLCLCAAVFAGHAVLLARRIGSRSAALVAASEGLLALALLVRVVSQAFTVPRGGGFWFAWDYWVLLGAAVLAGIYGNLGYLGVVLDDTRGARSSEAAARAAAESNAMELRALLLQRDRLANERQRMLEVLAHEIRQPLNNAGSALQAAASVLRGMDGGSATQATARLQRAQVVLGNVNSVLDNTLAVASLLADDQPLRLQEVELDLLVDLVLGDLGEAERARVEVRRLADLRGAEMESGLMRLALRNLLLNALRHGGAAARVVLQVSERESPPALLLCVIDDGPGMEPAQLQALEQALHETTRPPGRGLGLYIARTVALRHGGTLTLEPHGPQGLRACMALPLPG